MSDDTKLTILRLLLAVYTVGGAAFLATHSWWAVAVFIAGMEWQSVRRDLSS